MVVAQNLHYPTCEVCECHGEPLRVKWESDRLKKLCRVKRNLANRRYCQKHKGVLPADGSPRCNNCGAVDFSLGGKSGISFCSPCRKRSKASKRMVERARKASAPLVESFSRKEIWERDGGICRYCWEPAGPSNWHLAHLVALAKGGDHARHNVAVSHPECNLQDGPGRLPVQLGLF